MKKQFLGFAAAVAMVLAYGCAGEDSNGGSEPGTSAPANDYSGSLEPVVFANTDGEPVCPVMGGVVSDTTALAHMDHDGKRYYFCCDGCPEAFAANPDKFADGKALPGHEDDHDHDGHDHDH